MLFGYCKCGKRVEIKRDDWFSHDNFEGQIVCHKCRRLLYIECKKGMARVGRCLEKPKRIPIPKIFYTLGQGVGQNYMREA